MNHNIAVNQTPTLKTERLFLRPLSEADADDLCRISNEPGVRRYLWDDQPVTEAKIREIIAQSAGMFSGEGLGLFGVRKHGSEDLLGFCGFARIGMEEPELGYELTQGVWGMGFATEASRACLRFAFEEAGLERVIAGVDPPNVASLRVIRKLGMQPAGNLNPNAPEDPYFAISKEAFLATENDE